MMGRVALNTLSIPPMNHNFPISISEQEEMNPRIQEMLRNNNLIPLPERLIRIPLTFSVMDVTKKQLLMQTRLWK